IEILLSYASEMRRRGIRPQPTYHQLHPRLQTLLMLHSERRFHANPNDMGTCQPFSHFSTPGFIAAYDSFPVHHLISKGFSKHLSSWNWSRWSRRPVVLR